MNNHSLLNSVGVACVAGYTKTKVDELEKKVNLIMNQRGLRLESDKPTNVNQHQTIKKLENENNLIASILINMKETSDLLTEEIASLKKRICQLENGGTFKKMVDEEQECDEKDYLKLLSQFEDSDEESVEPEQAEPEQAEPEQAEPEQAEAQVNLIELEQVEEHQEDPDDDSKQ